MARDTKRKCICKWYWILYIQNAHVELSLRYLVPCDYIPLTLTKTVAIYLHLEAHLSDVCSVDIGLEKVEAELS